MRRKCIHAKTTVMALSRVFVGTVFLNRYRRFTAYGTFTVALIGAGLLFLLPHETDRNDQDVVSLGLAQGYIDPDEWRMKSDQGPVQRQGRNLPSVPAMIAQLENRLATAPNDAKGWSLLAQSYAYIGNRSGIESAIASAVGLGIDESVLRSQVAIVEADMQTRSGL